jgi:hypothetical protein
MKMPDQIPRLAAMNAGVQSQIQIQGEHRLEK